MAGLDVSLFRAVNGWPSSFDPFLTDLSVANNWPSFRILMVAVVIGMAVRGRGRTALLALIAFPISDGLCNVAKHLLPYQRPFQELAHVVLRVGSTPSMGTASSHAANMAAIATVMTLGLGWRWGAVWIVAALLVGVSRVYVGAHYPSQVLCGWAIGVAIGFVVDRVARWVKAERTKSVPIEQPSA